MARASKGARHITTDGVPYRWRASGNDGWIDIVVWPASRAGKALTARVDYDQSWSEPTVRGGSHPMRQVIVTNRIVRRLIAFAVSSRGYDASGGGPPLIVGQVDDHIDLSDAVRANDRRW